MGVKHLFFIFLPGRIPEETIATIAYVEFFLILAMYSTDIDKHRRKTSYCLKKVKYTSACRNPFFVCLFLIELYIPSSPRPF